jgi:hypothetical protein
VFEMIFLKILLFLHLLTCLYLVWATSHSLLLGRTCSALLFLDFFE